MLDFNLCVYVCLCLDCASLFSEGDDQQTVWSGEPGAEGGQVGSPGAEHSRGRGDGQGEEHRVPVGFTTMNQSSVLL